MGFRGFKAQGLQAAEAGFSRLLGLISVPNSENPGFLLGFFI